MSVAWLPSMGRHRFDHGGMTTRHALVVGREMVDRVNRAVDQLLPVLRETTKAAADGDDDRGGPDARTEG